MNETKPLVFSEYWAKGLLSNKDYSIHDYWSFLTDEYFIYCCNFPGGDYTQLDFNDFKGLNDRTMSGVVNLILLPKSYDLKLEEDHV